MNRLSLRRVANLMRQDLTNALRDNILLYMMVAPLLLAIGARLFLPSLDQARLTFAVQSGLDPASIRRLEQVGGVEVYADAEAVRARVLRSDDVPGVVVRDGAPLLVMEGNEGEGAAVLARVIEQALGGETVAEYSRTDVAAGRSLLTEYAGIVFIMIGSLLGALVMAFNIIEDKETRAVRALGVSPLSMLELTLARGLFALVVGLALVLSTTTIILGGAVHYGLLLVGFAFAVALPILTGYVIGGLADSQLKAIAVLKFYMIVYLTVPIVSVFVPRQWHVFLYPLPNYWMWQTFESLFVSTSAGPGFWVAGPVTLASSLALVALLLPRLRRQLKLR